jgi:hypothetical protein
MVYKKFIKRDGKVYGPYLYKSVKKDGRVTTHYLGHHDSHHEHKEKTNFFGTSKKPSKKFWMVAGFLTILIALLVINLLLLINLSVTGKVSVELKDNYVLGEDLSGNINLVLKQGELVPSDSKLVVDNVGSVNTYNLKDLISSNLNSGNFFVEGKEVTGNGQGFGVLGKKEVYPLVNFKFKIAKEKDIVVDEVISGTSGSSGGDSGTPSETTPSDVPADIPSETPMETPSTITETPSAGTTTPEITTATQDPTSQPSSDSGESSSGPSLTGEVVGEQIIEGQVSKTQSYIYSLKKNERIQITDSEHPVKVEYNDNGAIITTDYSEFEEGFGSDYLTNEIIKIPIDISSLNLKASSGTLKVSFVYNDVEITSSSVDIKVEGVQLNETNITNITNITEIPLNETNVTINLTKAERINKIISEKGIRIERKVVDDLGIKGKVRVIVKNKGVAIGEKLDGFSDLEVLELDEQNLALLQNVEIVIDQPVSLLVHDSENIIRSLDVKNQFGLTGSGKKVCVIDTGVDSSVVSYSNGFDFVNNDSDAQDDNGHGTEVAYILNTIASGSDIYVAKVLDVQGVGYESNVLEGLQWCISQNVDVISFSIGAGSYNGYCDSNIVADLTNTAVNNGIFVVAATGNDGSTSLKSPSCASKVVRVSATDKSDNLAGFANMNEGVDVLAPGVNILTKSLGNSDKTISGTSASTPMVAGAGAIVLENETLSPSELRDRLKTTGKAVKYQGSVTINISRLDVYRAVTNNITLGLGNYTLNQTNVTNVTNYTSLAVTNYTCYGSNHCYKSDSAGSWSVPGIGWYVVGDNITVDDEIIDPFVNSVNVFFATNDGAAFRLALSGDNCSNSYVCGSGYDYTQSYHLFNFGCAPFYAGTYKLCAQTAHTSSTSYVDWFELNLSAKYCDASSATCQGYARCDVGAQPYGTWLSGSSGPQTMCCGDDAGETWDNSSIACCCNNGVIANGIPNEFCSSNSRWCYLSTSKRIYCDDTGLSSVYFNGTESDMSPLICSDCGLGQISSNFLCDRGHDGTIDGICGYLTGSNPGCSGPAVFKAGVNYYNITQANPGTTYVCDRDATQNGFGFVAEGRTAMNALSIPICDVGDICYDDAAYKSDCSLCSTASTDWDACDPNVADLVYTASGICTSTSGGNCSTGIVSVSNVSLLFVAGCSNPSGNGWQCDDNVASPSVGYNATGVCSSGLCKLANGQVCSAPVTGDAECANGNCDADLVGTPRCHATATSCVQDATGTETINGQGICSSSTQNRSCSSGTWNAPQTCSSTDSCINQYQILNRTGICSGAGVCGNTTITVTDGDVCFNGASVNPNGSSVCGTGAQSCNCGIWSNCTINTCSAPRYYLGWGNTGLCSTTDWQPTGGYFNVPDNYIISVTTIEVSCQQSNTGKSPSYNSCDNGYTRRGPDGYCDGAGSLDTNDAVTNVLPGQVCQTGNNITVSSASNCGLASAENCSCAYSWSVCTSLSNCTHNEYYVGYNSGPTCIETGKVLRASNIANPDTFRCNSSSATAYQNLNAITDTNVVNPAYQCAANENANANYGSGYGFYTQAYCGAGSPTRSGPDITNDGDNSSTACDCKVALTQGNCSDGETGCWENYAGSMDCCSGTDNYCDGTIGTGIFAACTNGVYRNKSVSDPDTYSNLCDCGLGNTGCGGSYCYNYGGSFGINFSSQPGVNGGCCRDDSSEMFLNNNLGASSYRSCCNATTYCAGPGPTACYTHGQTYSGAYYCNVTATGQWISIDIVNSAGCAPIIPGVNRWIVNQSGVSCLNAVINVASLNVTGAGSLTLTNVTLIVGNTTINPSGSFVIRDSQNTIWQNGNLTISGIYVLDNTTLRMNGTSDGYLGINVSSTGNMTIMNSSNITNGNNINAHYFFVVNNGALFNMSGSYLSYAGWSDVAGQRGLEISASNAIIKNNNFNSNFIGASIYSSNVIIFRNNITQNNNGGRGVLLNSPSNRNNLSLNNISTSGISTYGIYASNSPYNNISFNEIFSNGTNANAIYLQSSDNSTIDTNNISLNGSDSYGGIHLALLNFGGNISANKITIFGGKSGILISQAKIVNISKNDIICYNANCSGIGPLNGDLQNSFISLNNITTISAQNSYGIWLYVSSYGNIFDSNVLNSANTSVLLDGFGIGSTWNNTFRNTFFSNLTSINIYSTGNAFNNILLNSTFNESRILFGATGTNNLTIKWYVRVNVTNSSYSPIPGVLINVSDVYNNLESSQTTNSQGLTNWSAITDKAKNLSGDTSYNNHIINISKGNFKTGVSYLINQSMQINIVFDAENPLIAFVPPTYVNDNTTYESWAPVNISINESNLANLIYNWNGTNYSFYDNSLVLMMNFNNVPTLGENNTKVADLSKYGNNGVVFNGLEWLSNGGRNSGGFNFTGTNYSVGGLRYINLSNPITNATQNWTFSTWIKPYYGHDSKHQIINLYGRSDGWISWYGGANEDMLDLVVRNGTTYEIFSRSNSVPEGEWSFITVTREDVDTLHNFKIYVNGVYETGKNITGTIIFDPRASMIGAHLDYNYLSYLAFNGSIDDLMVFNRTFSDKEIQQSYKSSLYKYDIDKWQFYINQTGLIPGNYTYFGYANDSYGGVNATETRILHVGNYFPKLSFVSPTYDNNTVIYENLTPVNVPVNISINESDLLNFIFNWNGTNYSFYDDSLVLMMNFNNVSALGENDTRVADLSRYKNNGDVFNGLQWLSNGGRNSGGFNFTGTNYSVGGLRYINLSNPITNATQNWTFSTWIKPYPNGNPQRNHIINLYGRFEGWIGWYESDQVELAVRNDSNMQYTPSGPNSVPDGEWSFITMTREDVGALHNFKIYVNGVYQNGTNLTGAITYTAERTMIGAHSTYPEYDYLAFNGSIDDIMLYNRTFSQKEIQQMYYSNLYKYDADKWQFYANQTNLAIGDYTYYGYASDIYGGANSTGTRVLHFVDVFPNISFVDPTFYDGATIFQPWAPVNISINESNLASFIYNWNTTNYSFYDDSLVLMLNFNNVSALGENNSRIVDSSKYKNNGNCSGTGCPTWSLANGRYNGGFSFDGAGDYFNISNSSSLDFGGNKLTMSVWINPVFSPTDYQVISKGGKVAYHQYGIEFNGNSNPQAFGCFINTSSYASSNYIEELQNASFGQWQHVVCTYNGTAFIIYINGVQSAIRQTTVSIDSGGKDMKIGILDDLNPYQSFNGKMDEIMIWNRPLSAAEVKQLYVSNLYKYDLDKWNFFANQSNLIVGDYTYFGYVNDSYGGANRTETRLLRVRNSAPQIKSLTITPSPAYTNDTLSCNFNIVDTNQTSLDVNVSWRRNGVSILNQTVSGYQNNTLASVNLSRDFTYHDNNINCSIAVFDGFVTNSSSTTITIQNFTTSLSISQSAVVVNQPVFFTANYSSGVIGDIKQLIYNSTDLDTGNISHSIKAIDVNADGVSDGYVIGNGSNFAAFAFNGSLLWASAVIPYPKYAIRIGDIDRDNRNEILGINNYNGDLFVFNMTGELKRTIDPGVAWGNSLELGDINGDGQLDIIFGLGAGNGLFVYNSSGQQFWNNTALGALAELQLYDKNFDGIVDYIAGTPGGRIFLINATNGTQIWNNTDQGEDASIFMDINNDNISEILYGRYNSGGGDGIRFSNLTNGSIVSFSPFNSYTPWVSRDLVKTDLNGDGKDDLLFVYLDSQNPQHNNLRAINNSNATLWTYTLPNLNRVYNIKIANIDDDIAQELISGGDNATLNAFDINATNATNLLSYVWDTGSIGNDWGYSEAIDTGDSNKDGIADIIALSTNGIVYITQTVSCKIAFNDSVSGDMTWNTTSGLWDYNRTFTNSGNYNYSITCEKGGYQTRINSTNLSLTNALPTVNLTSPSNNTSITNRTPTLVWNGTDLDGELDIKSYEINITCYNILGGGCSSYGIDNRYVTINTGSPIQENYTLTNPLKYVADNGYYYTWKVRANDSFDWGAWSDEWRFNVSAVVDINLTNRLINFGTMLPDQSNDTIDNSPQPFILENIGNSLINVSINSTNLWITQPNPSLYFQYKFDNRSEPGSFNWSLSQITWKNVPTQGEVKNVLAYFNWQDANDRAEIDINVTVPGTQEGAGVRSSLINFTASLGE